jgi:hypothetical protein
MYILIRLGAILILVAMFWPIPILFAELGSLALFGKLLVIQSWSQAGAMVAWSVLSVLIVSVLSSLLKWGRS